MRITLKSVEKPSIFIVKLESSNDPEVRTYIRITLDEGTKEYEAAVDANELRVAVEALCQVAR